MMESKVDSTRLDELEARLDRHDAKLENIWHSRQRHAPTIAIIIRRLDELASKVDRLEKYNVLTGINEKVEKYLYECGDCGDMELSDVCDLPPLGWWTIERDSCGNKSYRCPKCTEEKM